MEIKGTIIQVLPIKTGDGKNGTWKSQDYIIETEGKYPKKVCVNVWGNNIDKFALCVNDKVTAHIEIESREYKDSWFTTVRAWKVEKEAAQTPVKVEIEHVQQPAQEVPQSISEESGNGLPF